MNNHLEHLEDLLLDGHNSKVIATLSKFLQSYKLPIKYDGSPSIFYGVDPSNNKRFIAKKSIFNKIPVVYHDDKEIDESNLPDKLKVDFKICLEELSDLPITSGIIQGDLMFTSASKKEEILNGISTVCCQPNLLIYPLSAEAIEKKLGIAWHTRYPATWADSSIFDIVRSEPVYGEDFYEIFEGKMKHYIYPAFVKSELFSKTQRDLVEFTEDFPPYYEISNFKHNYLKERLRVVLNKFIKDDKKDPQNIISSLLIDVSEQFTRKIANLKTAKGKENKRQEWLEVFAEFNDFSTGYINVTFKSMREVSLLKTKLLEEVWGRTKGCWVKTKSGICQPVSHEGLVITVEDSSPVKIVDREMFSYMNFSEDYEKGWSKND